MSERSGVTARLVEPDHGKRYGVVIVSAVSAEHGTIEVAVPVDDAWLFGSERQTALDTAEAIGRKKLAEALQ